METNSTCTTNGVKKEKKRKPRKFWMDPLNCEKRLSGHFHLIFKDLQTNNSKCIKALGMSISSFNELLTTIKPKITYTNTNMRLSVSPEERLTITLKHLSTGDSFTTLHTEFLIGISTVSNIVNQTCLAICESITDTCMPKPSMERWLDIADLFYKRTTFPNCLGAISGKIFNLWKADAAVILIAIVDANYCFVDIDIIDTFDEYCCANIFYSSTLGKKFKDKQMNIPPACRLPGDSEGELLPYVIVSDASFSKSAFILRPFSCKKTENTKQIFNYRCSRANRMADSTFGILTSKWKALGEKLSPNPVHAGQVIKACVLLHNYVFRKEGAKFEDTLYTCNLESLINQDARARHRIYVFRNYFADYFVSPVGAVSWQDKMIETEIN